MRRDGASFIGADSLAFISIDGLYRAMGEPEPRCRRAAILRRLLHRRLSDPARRPRCRQGLEATVAADRKRVSGRLMTGVASRCAGHRRLPRHRLCRRRTLRRRGRPCRRGGPHQSAASRSSTTRSAGGPAATLLCLDLARSTSIDQLGGALYQRFGQARHSRRQCRQLLGPLSPIGHIERANRRRHSRPQLHRQFPLHPRPRSAAAPVAPPAVRSSPPAPPTAAHALLGRLCRDRRPRSRRWCAATPPRSPTHRFAPTSSIPGRPDQAPPQRFPRRRFFPPALPDDVTEAFVRAASADGMANGAIFTLS